MKTTQPTPTLICISSDETMVTYSYKGEIGQAEIQQDQDGDNYYFVDGKVYYIPLISNYSF